MAIARKRPPPFGLISAPRSKVSITSSALLQTRPAARIETPVRGKTCARLHRQFAGRRLNMVNGRKEFFRATIEETEAVFRERFSKPVEVTRIAEAAEYRQSVRLGAPHAPEPPDDDAGGPEASAVGPLTVMAD